MAESTAPFFENKGKGILFNAANSGTLQLLYTPGQKDGVDLSGYIVDFLMKCKIRSIPELIPSAAAALSTRSEQSAAFYDVAKTHPSKRFILYFEYPEQPGIYFDQGEALLWNRNPYYSLNLIPRLTIRNTVMVGKGVKVWGKFEDDPTTTWNGLLSGSDIVTINIAASEEAPSSDAFQLADPEIKTLTLTDANTEYPLIIPSGTRRFYMKCRGDLTRPEPIDPIADFRYAWISGIVATRTGDYEVVAANVEEGESGVYLVNKTLYLASSTPGVVVIGRFWK
ncbi:MAG: hypothetical protein KME19_08960 [Microcoleus vaginatus WJT46-NPBG5]|jgi:hypothetical protein|nr:hypothetical protein [Microcoleus vaginatus WJT46-NPBG5]MBW4680230.1 hypothetical protein [Microcoleus vaginatus WJT46-NPBG5]